MTKPNRQQLRVEETRAKLLDAAALVFVREGYEKAQLDEIAALAGRSKGAVYTHFKSKEDLYLALLEHRTKGYYERFSKQVGDCSTRKGRLEILRNFYFDILEDKSWPLMTLEFRIFALRHPESREQLRRVEDIKTYDKGHTSIAKMLASSSQAQTREDKLAIVCLSHIIGGLMLESHFEPKVLSAKVMRRFLGTIFDALFPERD